LNRPPPFFVQPENEGQMANSTTQLILCVLVAIWCVYSLVALGELR
jgi:hypothetical protein